MLVAMVLATVGAAVTAQTPAPDGGDSLSSSAATTEELADLASPQTTEPQVPVRSGLLSDQPEADDDGAVPVGIFIRDINLEATVLAVGVDDENRFDVPEADTVGWYKYSSRPGSVGATVLAAHVDYGGRAGAFYNLRQLRVGDRLAVQMSDGSVVDYAVTNNTVYDKKQLPAGDLFRKEGTPVLQLITCGGVFDPSEQSYEANIVVSAEPLTT